MGPVNSRPRPVLHGGPGTEPRPCMVLGLKPMGKPSTKKKLQVLYKTKALHGPRTQAYGESSRLKNCKMLRPIKVLGCWGSTPLFGSLRGLFILASDISSDDYFLHHIEQLISISASFGVSILFLRSASLCQTNLLKLWGYLFLSKVFFGPMCH